jgi:deazaflavin-dependent oxidoreductase (nitroreductase family)
MSTTASVVLPHPPRKGVLWLYFKFPPLLYRLHLGWLLGHHCLLLTHQGRKTGRLRQTALDIFHFDRVTKECLVVSMYGEQADWYQNIQAHPASEVQTGWDRFVPVQRVLPPEEAKDVMTAFWRRYPRGVRLGLRLLGFHYDETEASKQAILSSLRVVSFRPKASL